MVVMSDLLMLISKFMVIAFPVAFTMCLIEKICHFCLDMMLGKDKVSL